MYISCYSELLHVLVVHISHHQIGYWFTNGVKGVRPILKNSGYKVIVKFLIVVVVVVVIIVIIIIIPKNE